MSPEDPHSPCEVFKKHTAACILSLDLFTIFHWLLVRVHANFRSLHAPGTSVTSDNLEQTATIFQKPFQHGQGCGSLDQVLVDLVRPNHKWAGFNNGLPVEVGGSTCMQREWIARGQCHLARLLGARSY